jgi:hypothetical protein
MARLLSTLIYALAAFSHFESDECGTLNEFLTIAPKTGLNARWAASTIG